MHRYITIIFESLGESDQYIDGYFWRLFEIMQEEHPYLAQGAVLLQVRLRPCKNYAKVVIAHICSCLLL